MYVTGITREHLLSRREIPQGCGDKMTHAIWCSCGDSWANIGGDMQEIARRHQEFIDSFRSSPTYMAKVCRV